MSKSQWRKSIILGVVLSIILIYSFFVHLLSYRTPVLAYIGYAFVFLYFCTSVFLYKKSKVLLHGFIIGLCLTFITPVVVCGGLLLVYN